MRKLTAPGKVMEYTAEYRNENDAIAKFISEKIRTIEDTDDLTQVDKASLRQAFKVWKDQNDQKQLIANDMEKRIEVLYGKYPKGGWSNFKLES